MDDEIEVVSSPWFTEELLAVPEADAKRIVDRLSSLHRKGWRAAIADGTIKHLRNGIWEVRVLGTGAAYRLLFFPAAGRAMRLVVVTTCVAKSVIAKRKRLEQELDRAIRRRDEWIQQHGGGSWKAT
jgi:hypothetical protein